MYALPLLLLSLLLSLPSHADIYQWQDSTGRAHYSDRPHADAKTLNIKPGYGFYSIKAVYDGDTVVLEDGRRIRLLGINTPEVQHRGNPAEAGGEAAKAWLQAKLQHSRVRLETDAEKIDNYGRTLAHLFTEQKEHINLALVQAGLATTSIYPPNLRYADSLLAAEKRAEQAHLGVWQRPEYAPRPIAALNAESHSGWARWVGQVRQIRHTPKSVYLVFSDRFEARIERQWLKLFPDINGYQGKTLEVRGWLNKNKQHFSLLLRHPAALRVLAGVN